MPLALSQAEVDRGRPLSPDELEAAGAAFGKKPFTVWIGCKNFETDVNVFARDAAHAITDAIEMIYPDEIPIPIRVRVKAIKK